jgi:hypothetical protein
LAEAMTTAPTSNKVSEQNAEGRELKRQSTTSTLSATPAAKTLASRAGQHPCFRINTDRSFGINTDQKKSIQTKRDEIEARWMLGDKLSANTDFESARQRFRLYASRVIRP